LVSVSLWNVNAVNVEGVFPSRPEVWNHMKWRVFDGTNGLVGDVSDLRTRTHCSKEVQ